MIGRNYISNAAASLIGSTLFLSSCNKKNTMSIDGYEDLDREINKPVIKTNYFNKHTVVSI